MFYTDDIRNDVVVENGVFKYANKTKHLVIPGNTKVVLGLKSKDDMKSNRFGWDIFYGAFYQNEWLESVIMPNSVKVIGEKAFEHAHSLKSVVFPEYLEEIKISAFLGDRNLKEVNLPRTLKVIHEWAFSLIPGLVVHYDGTTEEFNSIKKDYEWCDDGTLIICKDGTLEVKNNE